MKDIIAVATLVVMLAIGFAVGTLVLAYIMVAIPLFVLTVCLDIPTAYASMLVGGMCLFFFGCTLLESWKKK